MHRGRPSAEPSGIKKERPEAAPNAKKYDFERGVRQMCAKRKTAQNFLMKKVKKIPRNLSIPGDFLVRRTGFEPATY